MKIFYFLPVNFARSVVFTVTLAFALFFWTCSVLTQTQPRMPDDQNVEKFALLVGIDTYANQRYFLPLSGPRLDVEDMHQSLVDNFNFQADVGLPTNQKHIRVLLDAQATKANIIAAFRSQLRDRARLAYEKGHRVVLLFYFAGHGSFTEDRNGDERLLDARDTHDETLVPYDATRALDDHTHFDIVDDEITQLRSEVTQFATDVTFIFDCCHAGTLTRAPGVSGVRFRQAMPDKRKYPTLMSFPLSEGRTTGGRTIEFAACGAKERAAEGPFAQDSQTRNSMRTHGAFTYFLLQAMHDATRATKNSDIWQRVSMGLAGRTDVQHPMLSGGENAPFLGGARRLSPPPVQFYRVDGKIGIKCGLESGALPGGLVRLFLPNAPLKTLATGKLITVGFGQSRVSVPNDDLLPSKGSAELLTPYFGTAPLKVALSLPDSNSVAHSLREFFQPRAQWPVQIVGAKDNPDVWVVRSTRGQSDSTQSNSNRSDDTTPVYFVSTGEGAPPLFDCLAKERSDGSITAQDLNNLQRTLEQAATQRTVMTLNNSSGQQLQKAIKVEQLAVPPINKNEAPDFESLPGHPLRQGIFSLRVGQNVSFRVTNQSSRDLYVSLLWLTRDGAIFVMNDGLKSLKAHDKTYTNVYVATRPLGDDTLRVFVSTQPFPLTTYARTPIGMVSQETNQSRGVLPDLDQLQDQWHADTIRLRIEEQSYQASNFDAHFV